MRRDLTIDALRGFALFGILAVNIQCFVTGLSAPSLGILDAQSGLADHLTVLFSALLLEYKFYPIFSFCFGYGFAVQTRRWIANGEPAGPRFSRRMKAMLFMGVLHGTFLWFGDILTRYAITGFVLKFQVGARPRALLKALRIWLIATLLLILLIALSSGGTPDPDNAKDALALQSQLRDEIARTVSVYSQGSYFEATLQRAKDYLYISAQTLLLIPQFMVLFLLGALAAHLGLLHRPERYRAFWKKILAAGLLFGLPINAVYAWVQWQASQNPYGPGDHQLLAMITSEFAPVLALAYVASFALAVDGGIGQALVRLFAPAGQVALTMYISESLLMSLLLNGFGFGLGAGASPADLLLIAFCIYVLLLAASHLMMRHGIGGPLEKWWRQYTYRR